MLLLHPIEYYRKVFDKSRLVVYPAQLDYSLAQPPHDRDIRSLKAGAYRYLES